MVAAAQRGVIGDLQVERRRFVELHRAGAIERIVIEGAGGQDVGLAHVEVVAVAVEVVENVDVVAEAVGVVRGERDAPLPVGGNGEAGEVLEHRGKLLGVPDLHRLVRLVDGTGAVEVGQAQHAGNAGFEIERFPDHDGLAVGGRCEVDRPVVRIVEGEDGELILFDDAGAVVVPEGVDGVGLEAAGVGEVAAIADEGDVEGGGRGHQRAEVEIDRGLAFVVGVPVAVEILGAIDRIRRDAAAAGVHHIDGAVRAFGDAVGCRQGEAGGIVRTGEPDAGLADIVGVAVAVAVDQAIDAVCGPVADEDGAVRSLRDGEDVGGRRFDAVGVALVEEDEPLALIGGIAVAVVVDEEVDLVVTLIAQKNA